MAAKSAVSYELEVWLVFLFAFLGSAILVRPAYLVGPANLVGGPTASGGVKKLKEATSYRPPIPGIEKNIYVLVLPVLAAKFG